MQLDERSHERTQAGAPVLPIRPRPETNESRHGYLVRVANSNGYGALLSLCSALKPYGEQAADVILNSLNLNKGEMENLDGPWPWYFHYENTLL